MRVRGSIVNIAWELLNLLRNIFGNLKHYHVEKSSHEFRDIAKQRKGLKRSIDTA